MATTPEGKVKTKVKALLKARGVWYYMPVQNGMGQVGIPDFIICAWGQFLSIETKAPGKRDQLTPNQIRVRDEIIAAYGAHLVIDGDLTALNNWLTRMNPQEGVNSGSETQLREREEVPGAARADKEPLAA